VHRGFAAIRFNFRGVGRSQGSFAPPANLYDFSFLAPCPSSGPIVHGDKNAAVRANARMRAATSSTPRRH
jgi:alpha/beta superfamily hydrolase